MEKTCARCGRELTIEEIINYSLEYTVLGIKVMLHFCEDCICAVNVEKEI